MVKTIVADKRSRALMLIGIALVLLLFIVCLPAGGLLLKRITTDPFRIFLASRFIIWAFTGIVALYAIRIERRPMLLWQEQPYKPGPFLLSVLAVLACILLAVMAGNVLVLVLRLSKPSPVLQAILQLFARSKALLYFTAITAGITEELIFRGYLMPRIALLLRGKYTPLILSSLVFGIGHFTYGNAGQVIGPFLIGLVLGWYYQHYRSIRVAMISHALWDIAAMALLLHQQATAAGYHK